MIRVRLCGGPFDGERDTAMGDPPPLLWVRRCVVCKDVHWERHDGQGGDVYRYDEQDGEWHVYVYCDENLRRRLGADARELVPAGGIPDELEA